MSVARIDHAFTGGLWDPRSLRASEIHPELHQGPVPAHLLEEEIEFAESEQPGPQEQEPIPRRVARPNSFPCPDCSGATWSKGKNTAGSPVRRCRHCKHDYTVQLDRSLLRAKPREAHLAPCPFCGAPSRSKGDRRRCTSPSCKRYHRKTPKVRIGYQPCPHCSGRTRKNGKSESGKQYLRCVTCKRSFQVEEAKGS